MRDVRVRLEGVLVLEERLSHTLVSGEGGWRWEGTVLWVVGTVHLDVLGWWRDEVVVLHWISSLVMWHWYRWRLEVVVADTEAMWAAIVEVVEMFETTGFLVLLVLWLGLWFIKIQDLCVVVRLRLRTVELILFLILILDLGFLLSLKDDLDLLHFLLGEESCLFVVALNVCKDPFGVFLPFFFLALRDE